VGIEQMIGNPDGAKAGRRYRRPTGQKAGQRLPERDFAWQEPAVCQNGAEAQTPQSSVPDGNSAPPRRNS